MRTFLLALVALLSTAAAFAPARTAGVSTRSSTITMACRLNAKKEKRARNVENMRKFKKPTGKKFGPGKGKGNSAKASAMGVKRAAAREAEANFVATLFSSVDPDAASADEGATK